MNCRKGTRIGAHCMARRDVNHAVALWGHGSAFPSFLYPPVRMLTALKLHQQHYEGIWQCFLRTPHSHFAQDNAPQTRSLLTSPSLIDHEMLNNGCGTTPRAPNAVLLCHYSFGTDLHGGQKRTKYPSIFSLRLLFLPRRTHRLLCWPGRLVFSSAVCLLNAPTVRSGSDSRLFTFSKNLGKIHFRITKFTNCET